MPEEFTVQRVKFAGEKPNPHGGTLYKFYVSLVPEVGVVTDEVYWQRKSRELEVGEKFYGHIEQGEYGPRFKTDQRPDGGPPSSSGTLSKDDYWRRKDERDIWSQRRQGRAHAQDMALRWFALADQDRPAIPAEADSLLLIINWFDRDVLDADVGSGQAVHGASDNHPPVAEDAADLSAETSDGRDRQVRGAGSGVTKPGIARPPISGGPVDTAGGDATGPPSEEASPQLKGQLTQLFNKAGLSREAMKAIVLFRCGAEKATKKGASQLITDLQEGATHDALLAEIYDAKRAGNPLGARAAALIPTEVPWEDDGSLPPSPNAPLQ